MAKSKYPGVYPIEGRPNRWYIKACFSVNKINYQKTITVTAKSEKQAYDIKIKYIAEQIKILSGEECPKKGNISFRELLKLWKEVQWPKISPTSQASYRSTIERYLEPYFGAMSLDRITSAVIYTYQDYLEKNTTLKPKSIYNQLMMLRGIFTFGKKRGFVSKHPFEEVTIEKVELPDIDFFSEQQMIKIINQLNQDIEDLHYAFQESIKYKKLPKSERERRQNLRLLDLYGKRLYINLCIVTGARRGEISALTWSQINTTDLVVNFNGTSYTPTGDSTKKKDSLKNKKKVKRVTINEPLLPMIEEYQALQKLVIKQNGWKYNDFVFLAIKGGKYTSPGDPVRPDMFTQWFPKWCEKNQKELGLNDKEVAAAHIHQLRHSSISFGMNMGVPLKALAERSGHLQERVTIERYSHVYTETERAAANNFNRLYEQSNKK